MSRHHTLALLLATALLLPACGLELERPPLELVTRDSLVGAGKIVRITNTTNGELTGLEVVITSPEGETRSYTEESLAAYETVEIGWKKLGGWQVVPGSEVRVRVKGYLLAYSGRLGEPQAPDDETTGTD